MNILDIAFLNYMLSKDAFTDLVQKQTQLPGNTLKTLYENSTSFDITILKQINCLQVQRDLFLIEKWKKIRYLGY